MKRRAVVFVGILASGVFVAYAVAQDTDPGASQPEATATAEACPELSNGESLPSDVTCVDVDLEGIPASQEPQFFDGTAPASVMHELCEAVPELREADPAVCAAPADPGS